MFRNYLSLRLGFAIVVLACWDSALAHAKTHEPVTGQEPYPPPPTSALCPHTFLGSLGDLHFYSVVECVTQNMACTSNLKDAVVTYNGSALTGCVYDTGAANCKCLEPDPPVNMIDVGSTIRIKSHYVSTTGLVEPMVATTAVEVPADARFVVAAYPNEPGQPSLSVGYNIRLVKVANGSGGFDYYRAISLSLYQDGSAVVNARKLAVYLTGTPSNTTAAATGTVSGNTLTFNSTPYTVINR